MISQKNVELPPWNHLIALSLIEFAGRAKLSVHFEYTTRHEVDV